MPVAAAEAARAVESAARDAISRGGAPGHGVAAGRGRAHCHLLAEAFPATS